MSHVLAPAAAVAALLIPAVAIAADIGGTWAGSYTCNQGLTGLTLTVDAPQDGAARGVFRFYQVDANPGVPDGCFAMSGTAAGDHLDLRAAGWLYRPWGYITVDLSGAVSADGTTLSGSIYGPNCTTFELHRMARDVSPERCRLPNIPVS